MTKSVVIRHIAVASQILASGGKVANCLFHPSVRQATHKKYADEIIKEIAWCVENRDGEFKDEIEREYHNLAPTKKDKVSYDQYLQKAFELIDGKAIQVLIMNGKTDIDNEQYETGCNIVIGGNTLGRGVTFPGLQTISDAIRRSISSVSCPAST